MAIVGFFVDEETMDSVDRVLNAGEKADGQSAKLTKQINGMKMALFPSGTTLDQALREIVKRNRPSNTRVDAVLSPDAANAVRPKPLPKRVPTRFYLSANWNRATEMVAISERIKAMGHTTHCSWPSIKYAYASPPDDAQIQINALKRLREISDCDALVYFVEEHPVMISTHHGVEYGFAQGLGKKLIVIGQPENAFQTMMGVERFATVEQFLNSL